MKLDCFLAVLAATLVAGVGSPTLGGLAGVSPAVPPTKPTFLKEPPGPPATITLASGQIVIAQSRRGNFDLVGLHAGESVIVSIQYPAALVGHVIAVTALDGGTVTGVPLGSTVGADAAFLLKFRAGTQLGLYQVSLRDGTNELGLQFWVVDPAANTNPPVVTNN